MSVSKALAESLCRDAFATVHPFKNRPENFEFSGGLTLPFNAIFPFICDQVDILCRVNRAYAQRFFNEGHAFIYRMHRKALQCILSINQEMTPDSFDRYLVDKDIHELTPPSTPEEICSKILSSHIVSVGEAIIPLAQFTEEEESQCIKECAMEAQRRMLNRQLFPLAIYEKLIASSQSIFYCLQEELYESRGIGLATFQETIFPVVYEKLRQENVLFPQKWALLAHSTFDHAPEIPTVSLCNRFIHQKHFEYSAIIANEIPDSFKRRRCLAQIVCHSVRLGKIEITKKLLDRITDSGPASFAKAVCEYVEQGMIQTDALRFLNEESFPFYIPFLVEQLLKASRFSDALDILHLLPEQDQDTAIKTCVSRLILDKHWLTAFVLSAELSEPCDKEHNQWLYTFIYSAEERDHHLFPTILRLVEMIDDTDDYVGASTIEGRIDLHRENDQSTYWFGHPTTSGTFAPLNPGYLLALQAPALSLALLTTLPLSCSITLARHIIDFRSTMHYPTEEIASWLGSAQQHAASTSL